MKKSYTLHHTSSLIALGLWCAGLMGGCILQPGPTDCASGTGTLTFQNNANEAVQVNWSDTLGSLPALDIAAQVSQDEIEPTGAYTVTVQGQTSGKTLLQQSYAVRCDATTVVDIEPLPKFTLAVNITGLGGGHVASTPSGIDCSSGPLTPSCSTQFDTGTQVTLTAAGDGNSTFVGWSGACAGIGSCTVTLNQSQNVGAQFVPISDTFTVALTGNGSGTVSSQPMGIVCTNGTNPVLNCSTSFNQGTQITLTAVPTLGSQFAGWSGGGCSGTTPTCMTTVTSAMNVNAQFTLQSETLTVAKNGNGQGTVTDSSGLLNCGANCALAYDYGTTITLTASATLGSEFAGWSGACTGTASSCQVTMSQAQNVTAQFNLIGYTLSVTLAGAGAGSVSSQPAGISCASGGGICSAMYSYGTVVTLSALPASGSQFGGWSGGGCMGTSATCVVSVSQAQTITATFNQIHLTAPLITSVVQGSRSQGQIQAVGLNYYIAIAGIFPSSGGGSVNTTGSPYLGQIMIFAGNFTPNGWLPCDGRLLAISQNQAIFALLGTTYGGNGTTNFALPDLRGRVPMGVGAIVGGSIPPTTVGTSVVPLVNSTALGSTAQGQVNTLGVNFLIARTGIFPSRGGSSIATGNYIGQIMMFAGNFAPSGWAICDGSLLPISQNTALFSLLGTNYGGNGTTNFALPDLRGRAPMGADSLTNPTLPPSSPWQIPLAQSATLGGKAQGQIGVTGISYEIAALGVYPSQGGGSGHDPVIAQILMFAGNFAVDGWLMADGTLQEISQNTAFFSLIGTTFGGNGTTTFATPDLRARVPMGVGTAQ